MANIHEVEKSFLLDDFGRVCLDGGETYSQYQAVGKEIDKLNDVTGSGWALISDKNLKGLENTCWMAGAVIGSLVTILGGFIAIVGKEAIQLYKQRPRKPSGKSES